MLAWFQRAARRAADAWTGRPCLPELSLTDTGFLRRDPDGRTDHFEWADVTEIATCKKDCCTYDDVRLGFRRRTTEDWLEISEECPGFTDVADEMRRRFPSVPEDWFPRVVDTPFAENIAVLYRAPEKSPAP